MLIIMHCSHPGSNKIGVIDQNANSMGNKLIAVQSPVIHPWLSYLIFSWHRVQMVVSLLFYNLIAVMHSLVDNCSMCSTRYVAKPSWYFITIPKVCAELSSFVELFIFC